MRLASAIACLLLSIAATACDGPSSLAGVSEQEFVEAMAELRRIERDVTLDTAAKAEFRRNTLQERSLTPEQLEAAARALASDPQNALRVWGVIDSLSTAVEGEGEGEGEDEEAAERSP